MVVVVEVEVVVVLMIVSGGIVAIAVSMERLAYESCRREVTSQSGRATGTNLFCLATFPS